MDSTPPRTLPASWYTSTPLCQLERRAVFLKAWYLVGPIVKFESREPVSYDFSGVSLTVQKDEDTDAIVSHTSSGQKLRTHTTPTGLCFTTISSAAPSFHDYFPGLESKLAGTDFTTRPYRRSLKYPGHFNWKTMVDGYQECLHCAYTHPSFSELYPPHSYHVVNHHNWCQHFADPEKPNDGLFLYFFPNCTLNVYGGGISSFRVCPLDAPGETRMEFDYYNVDEGEAFEDYFKFVRQVAIEDFELCETAQYNLERGVYAEGVLNPVKETGVACTFPSFLLTLHWECHLAAETGEHCTPPRPPDRVADNASIDYQQRVLELCLAQRQLDQRKAHNDDKYRDDGRTVEAMPRTGEEISVAA